MAAAQAGPKIGGRYRLDAVLGRGGMGTVWAGRDELLQRDVAVKEVIPPVGLDDPLRVQAGERTMREARAAARIHSRSAVTGFDVVEQDGRPWIVMELLSGQTLDDVLREQGALPPAVVARIGLGVLDALNAAHEVGILHRDVKPANVMFRHRDDLTSAVLSDFGIAHFDGDTSLTQTGTLLGSPAYLAPERARGEVASPASDLWALGVTLFTAVEGVSPFLRSGPLPSLNAVLTDDLPPYESAGPLIPVLNGLLVRDPDRRMDAVTARVLLTEIADQATPGAAATVPMIAPPSPTLTAPAGPNTAHGSGPGEGSNAGFVGSPMAGYRQAPAAPAARPGPAGGPPRPLGSQTPQLPAPPRPRGSRGPRTVVLGAVALILAGALVAVPLMLRNNSSGSPEARQPDSANAASGKAKTCEPASSSIPKGYYRYPGPGAFTLALPVTWGWHRKSGKIYLNGSGSSASLVIEKLKDAKPDPYPDVLAQAKTAAGDINGYKQISVDSLTCDGHKAADWEYTSDEGRVLTRAVVLSDSEAYVLTWSTSEQAWVQDLATFKAMAATFRLKG